MEWLIPGLISALLLVGLILTQKSACEVEDVYRAVFTDKPFDTQQESETEWTLSNGIAHALYTRTDRLDTCRAETFNILVQGVRGGVVVTYVDGKMVAFTHNGKERSPSTLPPEIHSKLSQIAQRLRREL